MAAGLCGHVRCYGLTACELPKAPPCERLPEGVDRVNVRAAYGAMMRDAMRDDPEWTLHLARIAALDATRT